MKTICVAGKNDIAVNVLEFLLKEYSEQDLCVVCVRNDSGEDGWQKSFKKYALTKQVRICCLNEIYDIEDLLFLSVEFDRIIKPELFATNEMYNIHFSLLPKYKGCHVSVLPILFGDKETGVTFHRIDSGIDTGEIIAQKKLPIDDYDTSYDLYRKLIDAGTELLKEYIPKVIKGSVESYPQDITSSTYYPIDYICYKGIKLDVNRTAYQIKNQVRAFAFRPFQLLEFEGNRLIKCDILEERSDKKPGTIFEETDRYIKMASIDYNVMLYKDLS